MKILFFLVLIISTVTLVTFKSFESGLLNNGFSWTMSKLLPYLTLAISGILLTYSFVKGFKTKSRIINILAGLILFASPFAIGFVLHPIFEGDFSSEGVEIKESKLKIDAKYDLLVVTIPDCPFCLESISKLKLIKKRNPEVKILFSVCTIDEKKLSLYRQLINGDFDISLAKDVEASVKLAENNGTSGFPTFVQMKQGNPVYKWSNDQFGAGAIDSFEGEIK